MQLTHEFTVPAPVEKTWSAFNDIELVAGCFPGAQVTSVEGDTFQGSCKVKLGPVALVYNGSGTFVDKDEATHSMRLEAKGKDKRGNGTAGAKVAATLTASSPTQTDVRVVTELNITGKPAQFGRGVMQDVSDKLLGQFTQCLAQRLEASASEGSVPEDSATGADPPNAPAADQTRPPSAVTAPAPLTSITPAPQADRTSRADTAGGDALDLGATVLPVLAKSYWKQIGGGLLALLALRALLRRLRR
ncbi:MAG: SRPBCC family protein [Actinomycetota bacterium]|nr:SRPBCC family protein [Actinomycetota bacterium]